MCQAFQSSKRKARASDNNTGVISIALIWPTEQAAKVCSQGMCVWVYVWVRVSGDEQRRGWGGGGVLLHDGEFPLYWSFDQGADRRGRRRWSGKTGLCENMFGVFSSKWIVLTGGKMVWDEFCEISGGAYHNQIQSHEGKLDSAKWLVSQNNTELWHEYEGNQTCGKQISLWGIVRVSRQRFHQHRTIKSSCQVQ